MSPPLQLRCLLRHAAVRQKLLLAQSPTSSPLHLQAVRTMAGKTSPEDWPVKLQIGKREVVGFGSNGEEVYFDDVHYPFPAIRFKEDTGEIARLREKEKSDWKKLTVEEKKILYRASFCQTLVETEAPTGDWKGITGIVLLLASAGVWIFIWMKQYVYPPLPETMTNDDLKREQIQFLIDNRVNPIEGLTSNYDYEKNEWKWDKK